MSGRGYFITGTPRSGSTYLCRLLAGTGVLGQPEEWLDPRTFMRLTGEIAPRGGEWSAIIGRASTANGIFGVKVFASQVDASPIDDLPGLIASSTVVHLERRDALAQALSWSRAAQSGRWQDHQSVKRQPTFAPELIDFALTRIAQDNARWRLLFARRAIAPLHLAYEDYVRAPHTAVAAVAARLGIDMTTAPLAIEQPPVPDAMVEDWRERYLARCRNSQLPRLQRSLLDRGQALVSRLRRGQDTGPDRRMRY